VENVIDNQMEENEVQVGKYEKERGSYNLEGNFKDK
jgi:hypothetical protein